MSEQQTPHYFCPIDGGRRLEYMLCHDDGTTELVQREYTPEEIERGLWDATADGLVPAQFGGWRKK